MNQIEINRDIRELTKAFFIDGINRYGKKGWKETLYMSIVDARAAVEVMKEEGLYPNDPNPSLEIENKPFVYNEEMSIGTIVKLMRNNIYTIGDLLKLGRNGVYRLRNVGGHSLKEIDSYLKNKGIKEW